MRIYCTVRKTLDLRAGLVSDSLPNKLHISSSRTPFPLPSSRPIANMSSSTAAAPRWAAIARDTNETSIQLALNLDGGAFPPETDPRLLENDAVGHASQSSKSQTISVNTGIGFLDHMLHALAKHAGWSLALVCKGDLHSESPRNLPAPSWAPARGQLVSRMVVFFVCVFLLQEC